MIGLRPDLIFRWGCEEFVVLMPPTPPEEVGAIAERVRLALERTALVALPGGPEIAITASLGGAAAATFPFDANALLQQADAACYEAKRRGRNRVELAPTA